MLSVERYAWSCEKLVEAVSPHRRGSRLLLPALAHITERVYIYGGSLFSGATIAFPESLDTFIEDVKRCRPTVFISVPRLWAMFRIKIHEKLPQKKLALLLKIPSSPASSRASCKGAGAGSGAGAGLRLCAGGPGAAGVVSQHRHPYHRGLGHDREPRLLHPQLPVPGGQDRHRRQGRAGVTIKISDEGRSSVAATA